MVREYEIFGYTRRNEAKCVYVTVTDSKIAQPLLHAQRVARARYKLTRIESTLLMHDDDADPLAAGWSGVTARQRVGGTFGS